MLWRTATSPGAQPLPLEGTTQDAQSPAISRARPGSFPRLAYQHAVQDYNIVVMDRALNGTWRTWQPSLVGFIGDEQSPQVSPDGKRLTFTSDRSGWFEIWVGDFPDPGECRKLTSFQQGYVGSPQWSPDSQRIAFDARVNGNADIYVVRADGGRPVRLTHEPSVDSETTWSDDGRWVYFRSDRMGRHQIWKMPVEGGDPVQVTRNGGFEALESQDGKLLYYVKDGNSKGLWSVPVNGGQETKIPGFESVGASSWAVAENGIYWLDVTALNPPSTICFYDFATRKAKKIGEVPKYVIPGATGFSATRDGKYVLWSQLDRRTRDLMLVEKFR